MMRKYTGIYAEWERLEEFDGNRSGTLRIFKGSPEDVWDNYGKKEGEQDPIVVEIDFP